MTKGRSGGALLEREGVACQTWATFGRGLHNALVVVLLFASAPLGTCYSLLTHEEIVDILWKEQMVPLLLKRYPGATTNQLRQAHAYAYGGSLIHDIGYYPFGKKLFSDLTHYVRTGDFVANLVRESADLDQYAFALGALSHYSSDNCGHPFINHSVALSYPKLRAQYGDAVTFEASPMSHIRMEFGFDVTQVAKQRYTSDRYHDFIGFKVSRPVLERAFLKTYGLPLETVLGPVDLAIGTFRHAVSEVIPEMTRAALTAYHPELVKEIPNFNAQQFRYNLSRAQYETEWGKEYRQPGFIARALGFCVRWIPKFGLLKALAFKLPTPTTEDLYIKSVNRTVDNYQTLLHSVADGNLQFPNVDCDTGRPTAPGEYGLADRTYARALDLLLKRNFENMPPEFRTNILAFYRAPPPLRTKKGAKAWRRTVEELRALEAGPDSEIAADIRQRLFAPQGRFQSPKGKELFEDLQNQPLALGAAD